MKIAISGRGGVGKTTLCALLAETYAQRGRDVLAVDADPTPSLAEALAVPKDVRSSLRPISEMDELIQERTGAKPGASGVFFTLNPRVDDLPDRFSVLYRGVRLLEMGRVESGGAGCICPESAMLRSLFTQLLFRHDEVLLLDMEAGVEHLGRATIQATDALLVIVEPGRQSVNTAQAIRRLARDIGMKHVFAVANKVRSDGERAFLSAALDDWPLLGAVRYHEAIARHDLEGRPPFENNEKLLTEVRAIREALEQGLAAGASRTGANAAREP